MNRLLKLKGLTQVHRGAGLVWASARGWMIASLGLMIVQGVLPLGILYLVKLTVDEVAGGIGGPDPAGALRNVIGLVMLAGGATLVIAVCRAASNVVNEHMSHCVTDHVTDAIHRQSAAVDLAYYEDPRYHDTFFRAQQEAPMRPTRIVRSLTQICQHGISLLALIGLLFYLHWGVAAALFAASLPAVLVKIRHADRLYAWENRQTETLRRAHWYHHLLTGVRPAKEVRMFDLGAVFRRRHRALRARLRQERLALARTRSLSEWVAEAGAVATLFGILVFIARRALHGAMTIGDMALYYQAFQRAQSALQNIMSGLGSLYEDQLFLSRYYGFMSLKPHMQPPMNPVPLPRPMRRGVAFEGVRFRYPGARQDVLHGVDIQIRPGEVAALVGENGAGKTTVAKLLCRLHDPSAGRVTLDGTDYRAFNVQEVRRELAMIFQDYIHYPLSVRENIWVGDVQLDPKSPRIEDAARQAGADRLICSLPEGYETMLEKQFAHGVEISIGEWQKIALARAFLRDAQLIVLDEPTSAMSGQAEYEVFRSFKALLAGRAAVLISHRFSTVRMADTIYVLEEGRIVEKGSHDSLMARKGRYARLFDIQASHYR